MATASDLPYGAAVFLSDAEFSRYAASLRQRGGSPSGGIKLAPKTGQLVPRKGKVVGYGKWVTSTGPVTYVQVKWIGDPSKSAGLYPPSDLRLADERRHPNGDAEIRRLERALAADPSDDLVRDALERAQVRAGIREPRRAGLWALSNTADLSLRTIRAGIEGVLHKLHVSAKKMPTGTLAGRRYFEITPRNHRDLEAIHDVINGPGVWSNHYSVVVYVDPGDDPYPHISKGLREEFWAVYQQAITAALPKKRRQRRHPNYAPVDPHDPAALIDLALSYVEKPRPNVAKAREAMEAVYGAHPDLEEVVRSWVALARQGDPRAVIVLGWLAEFEIGFDLESADADDLFDRAIELGWPWATTSLLGGR